MTDNMTQTASVEPAMWFGGKTINEVVFCEEFLSDYPMISVGGTFSQWTALYTMKTS